MATKRKINDDVQSRQRDVEVVVHAKTGKVTKLYRLTSNADVYLTPVGAALCRNDVALARVVFTDGTWTDYVRVNDPPQPSEPMPDTAKARSTDPDTSHAAALSIDNMTARQGAVLSVVTRRGPLTHDQLIDCYAKDIDGIPQTAQSIRSRCKELVDGGFVVAHDRKGKTKNGGAATRWAAVES